MKWWGDLPPELLALVLDRLPVGDVVRFGAVCPSWRSAAAAKKRRRPTTPESPWLMLKDENDRDFVKFFSLTECRSYRLHLPQFREHRYICSSDGWLVTAESLAQLRLISPLTGTVARLPTLLPPGGEQGFPQDPIDDGRIIGYEFRGEAFFPFTSFHAHSNTKVVFFPSSSLAMATCWRHNLFLARIGGDSCTELETMRITDLLFHQGRVYGLTDESDFVFDFDLDGGGAPRKTIFKRPPRKTIFMRPEHPIFGSKDFLVETPDEVDLLRVVREKEIDFTVFKLDKSRLEWIQVNSLDRFVLFCGENSCVAISTLGAPELRANSIYFDKTFTVLSSSHRQSTGVLLFNIENGKVCRGFPPEHPLEELPMSTLVRVTPLLSRD